MAKCIMCEHRPANGDGGLCVQCGGKVSSLRKTTTTNVPRHFLSYRGNVVGLYPIGGGILRARLLNRSAGKLPKRKTVRLDGWCEGFSRETIKRFKACVLKLANA